MKGYLQNIQLRKTNSGASLRKLTVVNETSNFWQPDDSPTFRPKKEKDEVVLLEPGTIWNLEREVS